MRKLVDEDHNFTSIQASTQPWTEIRYAEVLLNHAEACYHLNGYTDKANKDIKDIRNRVGLSYTDKSGNDLIKAIRQERKVELAYEGHYYWDMRRWKLSATAFTGIRLHGNENRAKCKWIFHLHLYTM
ncbi:RagB/SusD family nutrient uptake outer membrane protein [Bacteroides sp. BFG-606]|nr:RagB/SusD family nutrient uptake outer membrane protein [Bacteroides sp. BFG-606]